MPRQRAAAVNAALDRVQLSIPSVNAAFGRVHDGQVLPNVNCATWVQRHAAGHSIPNPLYQKNKDTFMVSLFFGADDGNRTHTISLEG